MKSPRHKVAGRLRRHRRGRRKVLGTADQPRLCVRRALKHTYAQVIDDVSGRSLTAACTLTPAIREACAVVTPKQAAALVGKEVARMAIAAGVSRVAFDRGGCKYHGRVRAVADGAREGGLKF